MFETEIQLCNPTPAKFIIDIMFISDFTNREFQKNQDMKLETSELKGEPRSLLIMKLKKHN